jgi:hypothetical protein
MNQNPESNCFLWLFGFSQWGELNAEGRRKVEGGRGDLGVKQEIQNTSYNPPPTGIDFCLGKNHLNSS